MGQYTTNQKLYKVDPTELIDVESNLNYNWRKLDDSVKHFLGWAPTDTDYITGTENITNQRKFLKRHSNSFWSGMGTSVSQDNYAYVDDWTAVTPAQFTDGWNNWDPDIDQFMYSHDANDDVHLRGLVKLNNLDEIPIKVGLNIALLPVGIRPTQSRFYYSHMGNASGGTYAVNRMVIASSGIVQAVRYGGSQSSEERYISLSGISYPRDVGA